MVIWVSRTSTYSIIRNSYLYLLCVVEVLNYLSTKLLLYDHIFLIVLKYNVFHVATNDAAKITFRICRLNCCRMIKWLRLIIRSSLLDIIYCGCRVVFNWSSHVHARLTRVTWWLCWIWIIYIDEIYVLFKLFIAFKM
jgi:hypothetical protein